MFLSKIILAVYNLLIYLIQKRSGILICTNHYIRLELSLQIRILCGASYERTTTCRIHAIENGCFLLAKTKPEKVHEINETTLSIA